ncbi:hypothetical protein CIHG_00072 [Coccidioides immitis H538.4]|uniref:Uncharacterized protein n=1 Tax=Coccidioides immitis H538.4 TaxID=396776 RepID=A0A0J8U5L0_COCIT|nr:hypothetical protein CIHG_00072 [Coccidioides immitis H538.4]
MVTNECGAVGGAGRDAIRSLAIVSEADSPDETNEPDEIGRGLGDGGRETEVGWRAALSGLNEQLLAFLWHRVPLSLALRNLSRMIPVARKAPSVHDWLASFPLVAANLEKPRISSMKLFLTRLSRFRLLRSDNQKNSHLFNLVTRHPDGR